MFMFVSNVNAEACDAYDIKRLKEIAEGVEITYELQEPFDNEGTMIYDRYKIKITGLTDEVSVINSTDELVYNSNGLIDDVLYGGIKLFRVYSKNCSETLKKIEIKLPVYNNYYNSDFCQSEENKNKTYFCEEWVEEEITEDEFNSFIYSEDYGANQGFVNSYYLYLLLILVAVVIAVFVIIYKKKKEVLV